MKIISWNVRGLGSRRKRLVVKEQLRRIKPDIVILLETKMETVDRNVVASVWGSRFKEWSFSPSSGRSGGIIVMWNSQLITVVDSMVGEFSVSVKIVDNRSTEWWLSGIYGPCAQRVRTRFWEELADLYGYCGDNWCLGGDFNVVRFMSEKSNGGRVTRSMREFNEFIHDTNLRDPNLLNASFTWSNLRENAVCRRLDRFLVSGSWEDCFPHYRHKALPRTTSDHCPIELDTTKVQWGPSPFRFENMWLTHPAFKSLIKGWWNVEQQPGWEGYKFMMRLKSLKTQLKVWSKVSFGDVEKAKKEAEARLMILDQLEGTVGLNNSLRKEREDILHLVGDLAQKEEIKWRQRGKVSWAREGDGNTKFFHRVASGFRKRNCIDNLEVEGLGILEDEADIEREVIKFFKGLYRSSRNVRWGIEGLNWCPIRDLDAVWLERPFEMEEVRKAVFDCGNDKSPGPDGFSLHFFQSCWEIVKMDVMRVMTDFYHTGIVNGITNETFICLIPKKSNSSKVSDYRPISLVTSLYKVISKVLASRLREVLGQTISQSQGAFVQQRQILDAALVANEVVEEVRKKKKKGLVFKIDFEKAYDHVEWNFVEEVMNRKGFGARWRNWINGCLKSANYSVMINGRPRGKFKATRGIRQGDPLSPFLFTLVSDVLSRLVEKAQELNLVRGLTVGHDCVEVSHLQFADDTIFFLDGTEESWRNLLDVLKLFCTVSGMKINKEKSSLFGINFRSDLLESMVGSWGCEVGSWPMVYLGLPLGGNPNSVGFWNPVLEKVERRLQNWKRACLSKGGRLTLIQAVLSSIPSYYMSLFKMPIGVAAKLEQKMRSFLWEGLDEGKAVHLVNWKQVSRIKEEGGLGIGSMRVRNEALRAKWLWRFPLETNSLWHRVIKSKYGTDSNGWDSKQLPTTSCRNPWREISKGYSSFIQCCRFSVGNGEKVRFWEDHWCKEGLLQNLFPRLFSLSRKKNTRISAFVNTGEVSHNWDFSFRRNLTEIEIAEVVNLWDILGDVRLVPSRSDKRIWELENHGSFSCKSFRSFLLSTGARETFSPFASTWKAKTPPKVKFLVWLSALGKINTCDLIQRRHPLACLSPSWCVLCKKSNENINHLFIHCQYSLNLWWNLLSEYGVTWVIPRSCSDLLSIKWAVMGRRKRAQTLWNCLIHAIFWNVWLERNRRIFQNVSGASTEELWERVKFWGSLWASVSGLFKEYHYSVIMRDMKAILT